MGPDPPAHGLSYVLVVIVQVFEWISAQMLLFGMWHSARSGYATVLGRLQAALHQRPEASCHGHRLRYDGDDLTKQRRIGPECRYRGAVRNTRFTTDGA